MEITQKAEAFVLEWTIYVMLNNKTDIMDQAFSRTMLFLTFIKGPNVQEWVPIQVTWLGRRLHQGAGKNEEYLYDTVMDAYILPYLSVFYTDLFGEGLVFKSLSLDMIRLLVTCCHHVHS